MAETSWVEFSAVRQKRRRAALACEICHSKKVRCDLQARSAQGHVTCSNCAAAGKTCQVRPPRRDKVRGLTRTSLTQNLTPPLETSAASNMDALPSDGGNQSPDLDMSLDSTAAATLTVTADGHGPETVSQRGAPLANIPRPNRASVPSAFVNDISPSAHSDRYTIDPGFLAVYGPENENDARHQAMTSQKTTNLGNLTQPDLQQSFAETYFEYCYPWCPVLDKSSLSIDLAKSPLLDDALALVGSHVQPPMIPHAGPSFYYDRARRRFYEDGESDLITSLRAVLLFYWWAPRPPSLVHRHSSWWWTSVVIRHCQQAGFDYELEADYMGSRTNLGLRRRIWWTAFARERLTAICQGKPCIIDPEDCNIPEPSLADFPDDLEDKTSAEIFIYWVRLCAIIGRIAKYLSRSTNTASNSFPVHLGKDLIEWVRSLPPHLQLPVGGAYTANFHRNVHQLHLPYLTIIIVLYLKRSPPQAIPHALPPSILAATCLARIMKDSLVRGGTRYLMPITCWYCGMAFIALLQARVTQDLQQPADSDLDMLALAVKQLKTMWGTANVFDQGFERLRATANSSRHDDFLARLTEQDSAGSQLQSDDNGIDWLDYFPFATAQTSPIAEKLLAEQSMQYFPFDNFCDTSLMHFQDVFEGFDSWTDPQNLFGDLPNHDGT
ncbi:hypothetical protein H2204_000419 [Knufia peltigerae]|uniref:Zn(2)-C6 fungal-type domain-containing protein n=1 Tax=Knufia peltigerae TaxID=1002370 RepID=A0AA39D484_9EURO|nr:hypothetical protein H2204_000419 [Knufia peltigerae]